MQSVRIAEPHYWAQIVVTPAYVLLGTGQNCEVLAESMISHNASSEVQSLPDTTDQTASLWGRCVPHVLIIDRDTEYGQQLTIALRTLSVHAKHMRTVDEFLDLSFRGRVDLVSLEIDPMDPDTLDNIKLLRTHFGEGPSTRIVAQMRFIPGEFATLVEQRGADVCLTRCWDPEAMAEALTPEIHKQMTANGPRFANKHTRQD